MIRGISTMMLAATACLFAQATMRVTNRWDFVGNTSLARPGACVVRLTDGRLLLAGGGPPGASRSVDVVDMEGKASPLRTMATGRARHTCTLLADGSVLLTGGFDEAAAVAEASLFDPRTGEWAPAGAMAVARFGHTATLLSDGRVLIAGGENSEGALASLEVYDPARRTFTQRGVLTARRKDHAAALLRDGRVVLAGGADERGVLASIEVVNVRDLSVALKGRLNPARSGLSATALPDGTVMLAGGSDGKTLLPTVEILDPETGAITETTAMLHARSRHLAFSVPGTSDVLLAGGDPGSTAELFSAQSGTATDGTNVVAAAGQITTKSAATTGVRMSATGAATLDQCANGTSPGGGVIGTTCVSWVNGNLNPSKASYNEGNSVPYRLRMSGLTIGESNTVTIEWDTTQSGKHALDYLTSYNRSVTGAQACDGVTGSFCTGDGNTYAIPLDPNIQEGNSQPAYMLSGRLAAYTLQNAQQHFHIWGGSITTVSTPTVAAGSYLSSSSTKVTITFIPTVDNPVIAWGGHIATRVDWGAAYSAVSINGSPFHTRLNDLNGSGGNQDRALSNEAANFPVSITITKATNVPANLEDFTFTASPGIPDTTFKLPRDDNGVLNYSRTFDQIYLTAASQVFTITESAMPANWTLQKIECSRIAGLGQYRVTSTSAIITALEGDTFACTFTDAAPVQVSVVKACDPTTDPGQFSFKIGNATSQPVSCGGTAFTQLVAVGASVTVSEVEVSGTPLTNYDTTIQCGTNQASGTSLSFTMPASNVSCTLTNKRKAIGLTFKKLCSLTGDEGKFLLSIGGSAATEVSCGGSVSKNVVPGTSVTLSEAAGTYTSLNNYQTPVFSCGSVPLTGEGTSRSLTMPASTLECTVTNTRKSYDVTLNKACEPTEDTKFTLKINGFGTSVGCGGAVVRAAVGGTNVTISEEGENLVNYDTSFSCTNGVTPTGTGLSRDFKMPDGTVSCTVTNKRKSYTVSFSKVCEPANDPGSFDLGINGSTTGNPVACGGTVTKQVVGGTQVSLTESGANGTKLSDYISTISCTDLSLGGTGLTRTFSMPDKAVSCKVVNQRPSVSVSKTCTAGISNSLSVAVVSKGEVCNTGPVPLNSIQITDVQVIGASNGVTGVVTFDGTTPLEAGKCRPYETTITPSQASSGSCAAGDASCTLAFSDKVTVTATANGGSVTVTANQTASCNLCK